MGIEACGHEHADDERCRHGNVVFDGFHFGDTVPGHKTDVRYGPHDAAQCGWCLLYGNAQPLTRDTRRCKPCSLGDHGACRPGSGCGCACACSEPRETHFRLVYNP